MLFISVALMGVTSRSTSAELAGRTKQHLVDHRV